MMMDTGRNNWRVPREFMGEIWAETTLENSGDRIRSQAGDIAKEKIRRCHIRAMVDTGARTLALPEEIVAELGLTVRTGIPVRYADGRREVRPVAGPVTIEILGRPMIADCIVLPEGTEPLIGQIILERLDLVADCANETLAPNPASPETPLIRV